MKKLRELVLDKGVDINSCDYDNRTALHVAAAEGRDDTVKFLLTFGANSHSRDRWGSLPLDDSRRAGNRVCSDYLESSMTGGTLQGQARAMYSQLLMRDSYKFNPSWGEMLDSATHNHVIAYDTENCAKGQIIEYDPAFLSLIGWLTRLKGTIFMMPVIHVQTGVLLLISFAYYLVCRERDKDNNFPIFPVFTGSTFGVSLVRVYPCAHTQP